MAILGTRLTVSSYFSRVDPLSRVRHNCVVGRPHAAKLFVIRWTAPLTALTMIALLYFFSPAQYRFYPRCLFHSLTGLDCPGCGALRATHHLLHGNFRAALVLNPVFVLFLPAAGVFLFSARQRKKLDANKAWPWIMILGLILFTVFRNLRPIL